MSKTAFIECTNRLNKNSFNALTGALESNPTLHDVEVYFWDNDDIEFVEEIIKKNYKYIVIGFSFFTTNILETYNKLTTIRNKFGDSVICIAGGPHPSGEPKSVLDLGFDYVLVGEGEEVINEFFSYVEAGKDVKEIKGVYSKNGENDYSYQPRITKVDLNKYYPFSEKYNRFGHIEITRGCPFACHFCQTTKLFGVCVRHRSLEFMQELMQILKRNGKTRSMRFITPNAFAYGSKDGKVVNLPAIQALLEMIRAEMPSCEIFLGSFPSEVRPEHVTDENMKVLTSFVKNNNIIMGAQTGSQRLLDLSHRGHTVEDIYRAVEISVKYKKKPNVDFLFGMPGESYDDIMKTVRVMQDLIKMGANIHAHTFMPLPQTVFADKKGGRIAAQIKTMIKKYIPNKIVYGDWIEQENMAQKITEYLRSKNIADLE